MHKEVALLKKKKKKSCILTQVESMALCVLKWTRMPSSSNSLRPESTHSSANDSFLSPPTHAYLLTYHSSTHTVSTMGRGFLSGEKGDRSRAPMETQIWSRHMVQRWYYDSEKTLEITPLTAGEERDSLSTLWSTERKIVHFFLYSKSQQTCCRATTRWPIALHEGICSVVEQESWTSNMFLIATTNLYTTSYFFIFWEVSV